MGRFHVIYDLSKGDRQEVPFTPQEEAEWDAVVEIIKPLPVPDISDRQFFQQLVIDGLITEVEAEAAVTVGTLPPVLQTFVDGLPVDKKFGAKMVLKGATVFRRKSPMTDMIGAYQNMTPEQVDDFFRRAKVL